MSEYRHIANLAGPQGADATEIPGASLGNPRILWPDTDWDNIEPGVYRLANSTVADAIGLPVSRTGAVEVVSTSVSGRLARFSSNKKSGFPMYIYQLSEAEVGVWDDEWELIYSSERPIIARELTEDDDVDSLTEGTYYVHWGTVANALALPVRNNIGRLQVFQMTPSRQMQVYESYIGEMQNGWHEYEKWVRGQDNTNERGWAAWSRFANTESDATANGNVAHTVVAESAASNWTTDTRYYSKNADELDRPASTIKVLTGYVARKTISGSDSEGNFLVDGMVTVTESDTDPGGSGGIAFQVGDEISFRDLLFAMMLPSSNWASEILARAVGELLPGGGDPRDKFINAMQDAATNEFGWEGATVGNPSGLGSTNQLSVSMLVELMYAASSDELFRNIMGSQEREITFHGVEPRTQMIQHTVNPDGGVKFPEMVAAKTGTLSWGAHACLVMLWEKPGGGYAASALIGSGTTNRFKDMRAIINYTKTSADGAYITNG